MPTRLVCQAGRMPILPILMLGFGVARPTSAALSSSVLQEALPAGAVVGQLQGKAAVFPLDSSRSVALYRLPERERPAYKTFAVGVFEQSRGRIGLVSEQMLEAYEVCSCCDAPSGVFMPKKPSEWPIIVFACPTRTEPTFEVFSWTGARLIRSLKPWAMTHDSEIRYSKDGSLAVILKYDTYFFVHMVPDVYVFRHHLPQFANADFPELYAPYLKDLDKLFSDFSPASIQYPYGNHIQALRSLLYLRRYESVLSYSQTLLQKMAERHMESDRDPVYRVRGATYLALGDQERALNEFALAFTTHRWRDQFNDYVSDQSNSLSSAQLRM